MKKEMHCFTLFCIRAGLILNIILALGALLYRQEFALLNLDPPYMLFLFVIGLVSCILLLKFNRFGFWLAVFGFVAAAQFTISLRFPQNLRTGHNVVIFIHLALIVILIAVLQIKKNGVSAWDHLKKTNTSAGNNNNTIESPVENKSPEESSKRNYDYVVVTAVDLRSEPVLVAYNSIGLLPSGTKLALLEKGEKTIIGTTEGYWVKVQEKFYGSGWCFSENLKKI